MSDLSKKRCIPCEGGVQPLSKEDILLHMKKLSESWQVNDNHNEIQCKFTFKNYYHTMAFVNAIAWISHHEDHHPDLNVSYNYCLVRYSTHAIQGLSENDFICAKKVEKLFSCEFARN